MASKSGLVVLLTMKTCPFCGSMPTITPNLGLCQLDAMVACENGCCHVKPHVISKSPRQAITRWNKRATQEATPCPK